MWIIKSPLGYLDGLDGDYYWTTNRFQAWRLPLVHAEFHEKKLLEQGIQCELILSH